jgi:hypothetical protein
VGVPGRHASIAQGLGQARPVGAQDVVAAGDDGGRRQPAKVRADDIHQRVMRIVTAVEAHHHLAGLAIDSRHEAAVPVG